MDTDLVHALCALGIFGIPLGVAWWSAFRGRQLPRHDGDAPAPDAATETPSWEFPREREP
jgi:hypothetical protein